MNKMENKLEKLFEYQRFNQNKHLGSLIEETLEPKVFLSEETLGQVAGGIKAALNENNGVTKAALPDDTAEAKDNILK